MKKIYLAALLAPSLALAQSYPSPTFSSIVIQNPLTPANGGTGATTSTGTGSVVLSNSPALVTPALGTPSAAVLTNATGLPLATGVTGTLAVAKGGTGVTASTGSGSVVLNTSPTLVTPALGTPSSVTLTNGTGLPVSTGISGLGTGVATGLANAVTGSGSPVLGTSPTIASPTVTGAFTATGLVTNGDLATQAANTILANATSSTASPTASAMPSCSGANNALRWTSGTGFACASSIALTTGALSQFAATTSAQLAGIISDETGSGSLVFGTSPTFTTSLNASTSTTTVALIPGTQNITFPGVTNSYSDFAVAQTNAGPHTSTSNSAMSVSSAIGGSGIIGPVDADYGFTVSISKNNFLTSSTLGEIDGINIITRQGSDDTDAILANVGVVNGFGGILEGATNQFAPTTGAILNGMDVQLGSIETGFTGAAGSQGLAVTATTGTLTTGVQIQSNSGAGWTNAIVVGPNGGGGATFTLTPAGQLTLGASGNSKTFRTLSNSLGILNNAQTTQILTLDDSGDLSTGGNFTTGGMVASGASQFTDPSGTGVAITANETLGGTLLMGLSGSQKTFRVLSNTLSILNNAGTTQIMALDDSGNLATGGNFTTGGMVASGASQFTDPSGTGLAVTANVTIGGTLSVTGGTLGITTGTAAAAGIVGEVQTATTSSVGLTSGTAANATSKSLTAGHWRVTCTGYFVPAGTTTPLSYEIGVGTSSATQPGSTGAISLLTASFPAGAQQIMSTPAVDFDISTPTTLYCVATAGFGTSTETVTGTLNALRVQ